MAAPSSSESSTTNNGNPLVKIFITFHGSSLAILLLFLNLNTTEQNEKIQKIASELKDIFSSTGSFNGCSDDSSAGSGALKKNKTYEEIMKQFPGVPSQQLQHSVKSAHSLFPCKDDDDKMTDDGLLFQKPVLYEGSKGGDDIKTKQPLHFASRIQSSLVISWSSVRRTDKE
eukprot:CAMPEP_0178955540 /NCGR_PEP_ID=MMETSP0789-20121207/9665_1 /TAXON_ID=3005 /ORGANISM="Rhizosolenia setigera, Strain CCMP 1694" /LENGTH=171 /DNA_ID=CAMNT_0020637189 /DNA_START=492 /DNA_END=1008 /DNA_ORIENTATION=+